MAQSLRSAHIDFEIFERDLSPWDRPQGYRLHLEADALNALREVFPSGLHRLFEATVMRTNPFATILKQDLSVLKRMPTDDGQDAKHWPQFITEEKIHCNVDRATLREIVLLGIEDRCRFNKRLLYYDSSPENVTVTFTDGTIATGDVLIAADGIRSVVRQQRAPQLKLMDAGGQAIYGRVPYVAATRLPPGETLNDIFGIAVDERKLLLGTGAVKFPTAPDIAAQQLTPPVTLKPQEDYAVCIVGGRHELFPKTARELRDASSQSLQTLSVDMLAAWPQPARDLVASGESDSFFTVSMLTSIPGKLEKPTNVTLLGDAIHAMTPTLGRGGNLAMRDAALLGRQLQAVSNGEKSMQGALAVYEEELVRYGFDVVRESVEIGQKRMGQNPLPESTNHNESSV